MNDLPIIGLNQEEQKARMDQLFLLMGAQVKSYHKQHHMGESTSVSVELAQELLESMLYTLDQAGSVAGNPNISAGLERGQKILEEKLSQGQQLFRLVEATAPAWQGECRWDAVQTLGRYLHSYDWKHLAHKLPEGICYPLVTAVPERLKGIDHALLFLRMLWIENQIMDAFPEAEQERLWSVFCQNDRGLTENQCEQLLINAIGKVTVSGEVGTLVFTGKEWEALQALFSRLSGGMMEAALRKAASDITVLLKLQDPNAIFYVRQVVPNLLPRLAAAVSSNNLAAIFMGTQ